MSSEWLPIRMRLTRPRPRLPTTSSPAPSSSLSLMTSSESGSSLPPFRFFHQGTARITPKTNAGQKSPLDHQVNGPKLTGDSTTRYFSPSGGRPSLAAKRPSAARYKGMKRRPNNVLNDSRSLLRGECEPLREPDRPDDRPE